MTDQPPEGRERRRHPRRPLATPVVITSSDGSIATLEVRDVSAGGVFVYTPNPPARGTTVQVELALGKEGHFTAPGVVLRVEFGDSSCGCAIEFRGLPPQRQQFLANILEDC